MARGASGSGTMLSLQTRKRVLLSSHTAGGPGLLYAPALPFALIHRSAWKENSQKLVCRLLHSPAPWSPYGQPETSRLLKVDHYMLHVRTEMRSGQYAAPRQDTDTGGGVAGVKAPGLIEEVRPSRARCV